MSDFWSNLQSAREKRQAEDRANFFACGDPIPDLDMFPPCPICDGGLEYDEGFWCEPCDVQWDRYGHNGVREPE